MTSLSFQTSVSSSLNQAWESLPHRRCIWASQVVLVVQDLPANAGDIRDADSIPGWGRTPGGGHGNPLQYSCLENPMARRAWWATVHGVAKSWTQLKQLSTHGTGFGCYWKEVSKHGSQDLDWSDGTRNWVEGTYIRDISKAWALEDGRTGSKVNNPQLAILGD